MCAPAAARAKNCALGVIAVPKPGSAVILVTHGSEPIPSRRALSSTSRTPGESMRILFPAAIAGLLASVANGQSGPFQSWISSHYPDPTRVSMQKLLHDAAQ